MSGLLDFLQSASNTAASNVSAPVDGIAWLLRKAGVPVGDAPVGGSDWMAQNGLTRPVQQSGASLAGETLGLLAPIVAAAKAPQIAGGLLQMADNAMAPRTLNPETGAIVWHGSPHKFDKFDSGKIGTGEGAQAYGHGLYLAESPEVATRYKPNIPRPHVDGVDAATLGQPLWEVSDTMASRGFGVDEYKQFQKTYRESQIESALKAGNARKAELLKESLDEELKIADGLRGKNISRDTGSLYKVDLPDEHIAKMLDWDKPLSQQAPEVRAGLKKLDKKYTANQSDVAGLIRHIDANSAMMHSDKLRQAGIPGIRYLDGGSRGAGTGSSNFVVFPGNEDILTILERNGKGLLGQ